MDNIAIGLRKEGVRAVRVGRPDKINRILEEITSLGELDGRLFLFFLLNLSKCMFPDFFQRVTVNLLHFLQLNRTLRFLAGSWLKHERKSWSTRSSTVLFDVLRVVFSTDLWCILRPLALFV